jgi:hypothetical protein
LFRFKAKQWISYAKRTGSEAKRSEKSEAKRNKRREAKETKQIKLKLIYFKAK